MNGKQAKRLRRQAEGQTTGWLAHAYTVRRDRDGAQFVELIPGCTRAVYKRLKRFRPAPRRR